MEIARKKVSTSVECERMSRNRRDQSRGCMKEGMKCCCWRRGRIGRTRAKRAYRERAVTPDYM